MPSVILLSIDGLFCRYFNYRDKTVFVEEEKRLKNDECDLKMVTQAEEDLKAMLDKVSPTCN